MNASLALILSAVSALVSLLVFIFARIAEARASARENGAAGALLEQINARLTELISSMAKQDVRIETLMGSLADDRERIAKVEEQARTLLRRANEIARWRDAGGL